MEQIVYRISRLISFLTIVAIVVCAYTNYEYYTAEYVFVSRDDIRPFGRAFFSYNILTKLITYSSWFIVISLPSLLVFNWIVFGKISIWIKKPTLKEEE